MGYRLVATVDDARDVLHHDRSWSASVGVEPLQYSGEVIEEVVAVVLIIERTHRTDCLARRPCEEVVDAIDFPLLDDASSIHLGHVPALDVGFGVSRLVGPCRVWIDIQRIGDPKLRDRHTCSDRHAAAPAEEVYGDLILHLASTTTAYRSPRPFRACSSTPSRSRVACC